MRLEMKLATGQTLILETKAFIDGKEVDLTCDLSIGDTWSDVPNSYGIPVQKSRGGWHRIFTHATSKVVQALSFYGWSFDRVQKVLRLLSCESTHETAFTDGRNEKYRDPAALTMEQLALLAGISEEPLGAH